MTKGVTIRCKAPDGKLPQTFRDAEVLVDGKPLGKVLAVDVRLDWNEPGPVTAKIELMPDSVEIEAFGYTLICRHDGEDYVLVPRDHWERIQRRLYELRDGEHG